MTTTAANTGHRPPSAQRLASAAGWIAAAGLILLTATGLWLFFFYQPAVAEAWTDIGSVGEAGTASLWIQRLHRLATPVTLIAITSWLVLWMSAARSMSGRRLRLSLIGGLAALGAVAAGLSGLWLPWDQLALGSVTVGTEISGYQRILQADDVVFVLIDERRISLSTMQRLLVLHLVVGTASAVAMVVLCLSGLRGGRGRRGRLDVEA